MEIKRRYILDERNHAVAVQVDIQTFERIEETLENYGLMRLMQEEEKDDEVLETRSGTGLLRRVGESRVRVAKRFLKQLARLSPDTRTNIEI